MDPNIHNKTIRAVDPITRECIKCKNGEHLLSDHSCGVCLPNQKYDYNNYCTNCSSGQYFDNITNMCVNLKYNEGFDPFTMNVIICPDESKRDTKTGFCRCSNKNGKKQGILPNGKCGFCNEEEGYGISKETFHCEICDDNHEIDNFGECHFCNAIHIKDPITKKCVLNLDYYPSCNYQSVHGLEAIINYDTNIITKVNDMCRCINESLKLDIALKECREMQIDDLLIDEYYIQKCPNSYCIDPETQKCREVGIREGTDPSTDFCKNCTEYGLGIEKYSYKCVSCRFDECIDILSGNCIKMDNNTTRDPNTHKCKCIDPTHGWFYSKCAPCSIGQVINSDNICDYCGSRECIDIETKQCRDRKDNEAINISNKRCIQCPDDSDVDFTSNSFRYQCKCKDPYKGFDPITGQCIQCKEGEAVDQNDFTCKHCKDGEGMFSGNCQTCPNQEGINDQTGECGSCNENEGILPNFVCGQCPPNSTFNSETLECECNKGFIYSDSECKMCEPFYYPYTVISGGVYCKSCTDEGKCIDPDTWTCKEMKYMSNYGKNPFTGMCYPCPVGSSANSKYMCECYNDKGFNQDFTECDFCQPLESINQFGQCSKWNGTTCIDQSTNKWINAVNPYFTDYTTKKCITTCNEHYHSNSRICKTPENSVKYNSYSYCKSGEGVIEPGFKCGKCSFKQGISPESGFCVECPPGYCINQKGYCEKMKYNAINLTDGKCINKCDIGEGIIYETNLCGSCKAGECISLSDNLCRKRRNTEIIDPITKYCICPPNQGINKLTHECEECGFGYCIDSNGTLVSVSDSKEFNFIDPSNKACLKSCDIGYDPLTKYCGNCASGTIVNDSKCICPNLQGVLNDTFKCDTCPDYYAIDPNTSYCIKCKVGYGIDPETKKCIECTNGEGIDSISRICHKCNKNEGINPITKECGKCRPNEGISAYNGICIPCLYPYIYDESTNNCSCPTGQGFNNNNECGLCRFGTDPDTHQCVDCSLTNRGIDHDSRFCRVCNSDEGIDPFTLECIKCYEGSTVSSESPFCKCPDKQGYDIKKQKCSKCEKLYGIDPTTNRCVKCPIGYGINPETLECSINYKHKYGIDPETGIWIKCPDGKGTNAISHICEECPDGEGILIQNGNCGKCKYNQYIDNETKKCKCLNSQGFDYFNNVCKNCDEYGLILDQNNMFCVCKGNKGFDPITHKCVDCINGTGVDPQTNMCTEIKDNECINVLTGEIVLIPENMIKNEYNYCVCGPMKGLNETTQKCETCGYGYGIDPITSKCKKCDKGQGINSNTLMCGECNFTQGIDLISGYCKACDDLEGINQSTRFCETCPEKHGINPITRECQICNEFEGEGINKTTRLCIKCDENYIIDAITGECTQCKQGTEFNPDTGICECIGNKGFDKETGECIDCLPGEGIDPITKICGKCSNGEGINPTTHFCTECELGQGIDPINGMCTTCSNGEGIDQNTRKCIKCQSNHGIDSNTKLCGICQTGFGIDSQDFICKKCTDDFCQVCSRNKSYCNFCSGKYSPRNGVCVLDEILVISPTPLPVLETATIEVIGDTAKVIVDDQSNKPENAYYTADLIQTEKPIVIDDVGQKQLRLVVVDEITNITIQQKTSKPIEIDIEQEINNNVEPVITIDSQVDKEDTSIKGNGKLTLQNKENAKPLEINQITPKENGQLIINSNSKINVNKIDIYGISKVDFNKSIEKATVKSVVVHQKASTELDNMVIDGNMKLYLVSLVTLKEKVDLSKTNIELTSSQNSISSNPSLIGDLISIPKTLTIQNQNEEAVINEGSNEYKNDENFIIAESENPKFECENWAKKFSQSQGSNYNNAECVKLNEIKRLVANHKTNKKNSIGTGAIIGIAIAVIIVITVIVILIYFFVFRKRKSDSTTENDSLSSYF